MPNFPPAVDRSDNDPDALHRLIGGLLGIDGATVEAKHDDAKRLREMHSVATDVTLWRPVFEDAGLDRLSFQLKFGVRRDVLLRRVGRVILGDAARSRAFQMRGRDGVDYLGLFLLTVLLLEETERRWVAHPPTDADQDSEPSEAQRELTPAERAALRDTLVGDTAVRLALKELYHPGEGTDEAKTWEDVDFQSLTFHRLGTTSFILKGREASPDARSNRYLALKCVLYPYTKLPPVAAATRSYAATFGMKNDCRHLVSVWASTDKWIVMDFVSGETLAEHIDRELRERPGDRQLRLDLLEQLGLPLFRALDELAVELRKKGHGDVAHQDLSPTNIIVTGHDSEDPKGRYLLKLIDLGRNHLYTRAIGVLEGADAVYVAPEVKDEMPGAHPGADLYSLGQVLIAIGGVGRNEDGTVPDGFYALTPPLLARFIEDLIDQRPSRRLLLFSGANGEGARDGGWTFADLGRVFEQELDAVQRAEAPLGAPTDERWVAGAIDFFRPGSRSPGRLWRLRRKRKKQEQEERRRRELQGAVPPADGRRSRERSIFSRWLLAWSWVCATSWYVVTTILLFLVARDLGVDLTHPVGQVVDRVLAQFAGGEQAPSLERLVASTQGPPDFVDHLPERAIGLSFALIGTRYYQNLYAGLTPMLGHRLARLPDRLRGYTAESLMRLQTFWWVFLVLAANLEPRGWPIGTAIGMTGVFLMNWACSSFSKYAIGRARRQETRLSTVPGAHREITGLAKFYDWTPSMFFYALFVWPTAVLIYTGVLRDELVYAAGVVVVNIGLFYIVKCSLNGAAVRSGLARAFLAAERLRHLPQGPSRPAGVGSAEDGAASGVR